jgi:hypothetical protein
MTNAQTNEARPTVSIRYRSGTRDEIMEKFATFVFTLCKIARQGGLCAQFLLVLDWWTYVLAT